PEGLVGPPQLLLGPGALGDLALQCRVSRRQLSRSLTDPPLQLAVGLAQLLLRPPAVGDVLADRHDGSREAGCVSDQGDVLAGPHGRAVLAGMALLDEGIRPALSHLVE